MARKIAFELNHPKHYLQYKYVAQLLKDEGFEVLFLLKDKDVLVDLMKADKQAFIQLKSAKSKPLFRLFSAYQYYRQYCRVLREHNVSCIISKASPFAVSAGKKLGIKTIITPDSEIVKLTNNFVAPRADLIITPSNFSLNFGSKHLRLKGFFEEQYLSPKYFQPDAELLSPYHFDVKEKYAVLRFVAWNANHDLGRKGFSNEQKIQLVADLEKYGKVYISSEQQIPGILQAKKLTVPAHLMHQVLHFANLYVGDSQTMATEAALLGTPAVRCNSFVNENDMSNFRILEHEQKILFNFSSAKQALIKCEALFQDTSAKAAWLKKRTDFFKTDSDLNQEFVSLIRSFLEEK